MVAGVDGAGAVCDGGCEDGLECDVEAEKGARMRASKRNRTFHGESAEVWAGGGSDVIGEGGAQGMAEDNVAWRRRAKQ